MEHNHTNEDRAYALAATDAGIVVFLHDNNGRPTGLYLVDIFSVAVYCQRIGIEYEQPITDSLKGGYPTATTALSAAGRALGLHDRAKAILEKMAGPVPVTDIHGRVLAAEGYVLVPRDVAERMVATNCIADGLGGQVHMIDASDIDTLANALGGKKGEEQSDPRQDQDQGQGLRHSVAQTSVNTTDQE